MYLISIKSKFKHLQFLLSIQSRKLCTQRSKSRLKLFNMYLKFHSYCAHLFCSQLISKRSFHRRCHSIYINKWFITIICWLVYHLLKSSFGADITSILFFNYTYRHQLAIDERFSSIHISSTYALWCRYNLQVRQTFKRTAYIVRAIWMDSSSRNNYYSLMECESQWSSVGVEWHPLGHISRYHCRTTLSIVWNVNRRWHIRVTSQYWHIGTRHLTVNIDPGEWYCAHSQHSSLPRIEFNPSLVYIISFLGVISIWTILKNASRSSVLYHLYFF